MFLKLKTTNSGELHRIKIFKNGVTLELSFSDTRFIKGGVSDFLFWPFFQNSLEILFLTNLQPLS